MATKVYQENIIFHNFKCNALSFAPDDDKKKPAFALLAHGYTSHKDSILSWGSRLADEGIPSIILDLPGHYLGSFNEVALFEDFKLHAHEVFLAGLKNLKTRTSIEENNLAIIGGHSLGAMLALQAVQLPEFSAYKRLSIGVGLGMAPKDRVHVFDSAFYEKTMNIRAQLVSPAISPDKVFPWIKEEKQKLSIENEEILLITGQDDIVVGKEGARNLKAALEEKRCIVHLEEPKSLPHHFPDRAAPHIWAHLKKLF